MTGLTVNARRSLSIHALALAGSDSSSGEHVSSDVGKFQADEVLQHRCEGNLTARLDSGEGQLGLGRIGGSRVVSEENRTTRWAVVKMFGRTAIHRVRAADFEANEVRICEI